MNMSTKFTYRGVIVPVFTPFNNDAGRSLNLSIISNYAKYLASKKINGVLVNGSTGEGTSLSTDERKKVTEAWVEAVKETKQHLMIQVGGTCLKDVKELAAHAEKFGADSILCLPELYFKPATTEELIDYLQIVGKCASKTPLLYYHYPRMTSVNVNIEKFLDSIDEKIPTFSGIKLDIDECVQAKTINNRLAIFLANDKSMIAGCSLKMDSFIMTSLNFNSEPAFELLEFGKGNRSLKSAQEKQDIINKTVNEVIRYGTWIETMKIAMSLTSNLFMGPPRSPLKLLSKENIKAMAKGLNNIGFQTDETELMKMYRD